MNDQVIHDLKESNFKIKILIEKLSSEINEDMDIQETKVLIELEAQNILKNSQLI
jgi:hypothetical protein